MTGAIADGRCDALILCQPVANGSQPLREFGGPSRSLDDQIGCKRRLLLKLTARSNVDPGYRGTVCVCPESDGFVMIEEMDMRLCLHALPQHPLQQASAVGYSFLLAGAGREWNRAVGIYHQSLCLLPHLECTEGFQVVEKVGEQLLQHPLASGQDLVQVK